ncbi:Crp/Fnr family transcriptional regulator [Salinicola rhizosphaerae]|uniref:Crp/Fnr family transcriptional regulator n=1 Tax=Salinicola rhizosphaerae TaxID=1443141 RepID=A0ABQ3EGS0_9GAMM|nr:Crp/Fnr family transcriptional regulator [Salinicola rhizosphaerae]GHB34164.1 Crp/Fnr family transcriptional regulator [Salinicola rhizosphaerae]
MLEPCFHRLDNFTSLAAEEKEAFQSALKRHRQVARGEHLLSAGSEPRAIHVILQGWASRYKLLDNGQQHIVAYLMPGDICDVHITLLKRMDHSVRAETAMRVGVIGQDALDRLLREHPRLARALYWSMMVDESIAREWLINQAGRSAEERIAHLFCELLVRSRASGLADDNVFQFPMSQTKIGEAMGMTSVHANRVMQSLRRRGLIETGRKSIRILNWPAIQAFSGFTDDYLHLTP